MTLKTPKVSIGMPVYNGENFLQETLESLLSQTFKDFELIISDNASTDNTESICRNFQERDSRIKYFRNQENLGAAKNYNQTFNLASGEYFKWAAHDDLCHPNFLDKCVAVLDSDPEVVLAYTDCNTIDEHGLEISQWENPPQDFSSLHASNRGGESISTMSWVLVFGLIRSEVLSKTPLLGSFAMHDWVLIFELALRGKFQEVPEQLFSFRRHPAQFTGNIWKPKSYRSSETTNWFNTNAKNTLNAPYFRRAFEHFASCTRVPLSPKQRLVCSAIVAKWMLKRRSAFKKDLLYLLNLG